MPAPDPLAQEVIGFWFSKGGPDPRWFEKNEAFDREVRERFLGLYEIAAAGDLAAWAGNAENCLALILVFDQFPRNMFRGSARAFASDALALEAARHAVARGFDLGMGPSRRLFFYLPFEHAESLEDQERGCELTKPLAQFAETADVHRYAVAHRDIVARFGRFPHRNAVLRRASTPEEIEFLKGPGSSF